MATRKLTSIQIGDAGGGNEVTIDDDDFVLESFEDQSERAPTGSGRERIVGYRQVVSGFSHDPGFGSGGNGFGHYGPTPGVSQDVHAKMFAGSEVSVKLNFEDGAQYTYDPVRPIILPRIFEGFDLAKGGLLTHDAGSGAPPAGYTDQGDVVGGSNPSFEVEGENDGQGRLVVGGVRMTWALVVFNEVSASLDGYAGLLKVAIPLGTSPETYVTFDDVQQDNLPHLGEVHRHTIINLNASWSDWRAGGKIAFPAVPQEVIFGASMRFIAAGPTKSFLTIA